MSAARFVRGTFVVSRPDEANPTECPDCGFDAVVTFPIHVISEVGVSPFGTYSGCARCYDQANQ